jgi:hypothetical protein
MRFQHFRSGNQVLGILVVLLLIAGILGGLWVTNAFGWRGFRLVDAETFIGASLPPDGQNPQFVTENEKSRIIWLRFTLPAEADLTAFRDEMGIRETLREGFSPFPSPNYKETGIEWWSPHTAQSFTGLHAIHQDKVYELLIDQTDPNMQHVYMRVYAVQ